MAIYTTTIILIVFFSSIVDYTRKVKLDLNYTTNKITSRYFYLLSALILIIVAGLRWQVGTDYDAYEILYHYYADSWLEALVTFNEPGIRIISVLSSYTYDDPAMMFFLSSVITVGLTLWTLYKYSDYFSLSILLYIFSGAWHSSFNGVRQYLACAVLFAGHRYIIKREFWKYLLIVLLASAFHISALVMILLYFIPRKQLKIKDLLILSVFIFLGLTLYDPVLEIINNVLISGGRNPMAVDNTYVQQRVSLLRIGVMIAPTVLYLAVTSKKHFTIEDNFYINMLFLNASLYIITMNSAYIARFAIYTNIFIALGFPKIFKGVDKKLSVLIIYIALILYALFWGYELMNTENLRNFQWIFER